MAIWLRHCSVRVRRCPYGCDTAHLGLLVLYGLIDFLYLFWLTLFVAWWFFSPNWEFSQIFSGIYCTSPQEQLRTDGRGRDNGLKRESHGREARIKPTLYIYNQCKSDNTVIFIFNVWFQIRFLNFLGFFLFYNVKLLSNFKTMLHKC
jgi:hypothetical protein